MRTDDALSSCGAAKLCGYMPQPSPGPGVRPEVGPGGESAVGSVESVKEEVAEFGERIARGQPGGA
jgi:hypothetical protein